MKISLFQGIVMGLFGLGALIGLFVFATYKGTSKNAVGSVLIWGTLPAADVNAALANLQIADPDLKNVTYVAKDPDSLSIDLATAIATKNSPDLVLDSQEELKTLSKFLITVPVSQLPPATFQTSFIAGANIFAVPDQSGYYGVPFLVDPLVLYSNRTILSAARVTRPPTTWEALTGLVPSVSILTPARQIKRALVALGAYDNVRSARAILSTLFLQTGVPISTFSSTGVLVGNLGVNNDTGVSQGKSVVTFYSQFADPTKVSYTWNQSLPDSEQMFLSGDLALYLGYASRTKVLRTQNPNLDFIVTSTPEPATATNSVVYGHIYAFMIPSGAKNPTGAFAIAALMTNGREQAAAAAATGLAPAALSQLAVAPTDPAAAVAYGEALYTAGWLSPTGYLIDQVFSGMIGSVISGRSSIDNALNYGERSLTAALQQ